MNPLQDILDDLAGARGHLLQSLDGVTESESFYVATGRDGWMSIHDVVAHLAGAERGMLTVAQRTVAGAYQPNPDFDLDRWNASQVRKRAEQSLAELLADLHVTREATLATLAQLTPAQRALPTHHPIWGEVTVEQLFRIIAVHERMHRADIEELKAALTARAGD